MTRTFFDDAEIERDGRVIAITVEYQAHWESRDILRIEIDDAFVTAAPHGKIRLTAEEDAQISEKITQTHEDDGE